MVKTEFYETLNKNQWKGRLEGIERTFAKLDLIDTVTDDPVLNWLRGPVKVNNFP